MVISQTDKTIKSFLFPIKEPPMILYFTGTGNSLAVAQKIADATGDRTMAMAEATKCDLRTEKCIGLVYPSYDFNTPPAVRDLIPRLQLSKEAYFFIVITCGAQVGNSIWTVRRLLKLQGIEVAYCHKVRMPDNSATIFGRNPNDQLWKLEKYAPRLQHIIDDIKARRHGNHFGAPSVIGWLLGLPTIERKMFGTFRPAVSSDRCIGCGLCKNTCPIGTIIINDNQKAVIGDRCTCCLGCLHVCPQQAILVANKPVKKECQYRHPDIKTLQNKAKKQQNVAHISSNEPNDNIWRNCTNEELLNVLDNCPEIIKELKATGYNSMINAYDALLPRYNMDRGTDPVTKEGTEEIDFFGCWYRIDDKNIHLINREGFKSKADAQLASVKETMHELQSRIIAARQ